MASWRIRAVTVFTTLINTKKLKRAMAATATVGTFPAFPRLVLAVLAAETDACWAVV